MTLSQLSTLPRWQQCGAIARVLTGPQADRWVKAEREALIECAQCGPPAHSRANVFGGSQKGVGGTPRSTKHGRQNATAHKPIGESHA